MSIIVANQYPYVIGLDTHAATHTYAVVTNTGVHLETQTFPTTKAEQARALAWAGRRTERDLDSLWVIEGIGSYGDELAQAVDTADYQVVDAAHMSDKTRRSIYKTVPIDAFLTVGAVLPCSLTGAQTKTPRQCPGCTADLLTTRDELARERTRTVNTLLRTIDLGIDARRAVGMNVISQTASWRSRKEPRKRRSNPLSTTSPTDSR